MDIVQKFINNPVMEKAEYVELLQSAEQEETRRRLAEEAVKIRKEHYGNKVYIRGLIEFTNYCRNNCYYCGIRAANTNTIRYRLSKEEILSCCEEGHELGFRTFVLQGGEDPFFTKEKMEDIVTAIKSKFPDCAVTLSVGERDYDTYKAWKKAGADRFLLRHEAACETLYRSLHPENLHLSERKQCLYDLKKLGYQVGAGFMVGAPGQTLEDLAEDLLFLQKLQPEMVGMGPFIPHHETIYADQPAGDVDRTLALLSIVRIMLPKVLLPATTALGTCDGNGREKGMMAGANVVMPNLSPLKNRKQYDLYDNKISTGEEAAESVKLLAERMEKIGYKVVCDRGDVVK